jgi:hypothetical protein
MQGISLIEESILDCVPDGERDVTRRELESINTQAELCASEEGSARDEGEEDFAAGRLGHP